MNTVVNRVSAHVGLAVNGAEHARARRHAETQRKQAHPWLLVKDIIANSPNNSIDVREIDGMPLSVVLAGLQSAGDKRMTQFLYTDINTYMTAVNETMMCLLKSENQQLINRYGENWIQTQIVDKIPIRDIFKVKGWTKARVGGGWSQKHFHILEPFNWPLADVEQDHSSNAQGTNGIGALKGVFHRRDHGRERERERERERAWLPLIRIAIVVGQLEAVLWLNRRWHTQLVSHRQDSMVKLQSTMDALRSLDVTGILLKRSFPDLLPQARQQSQIYFGSLLDRSEWDDVSTPDELHAMATKMKKRATKTMQNTKRDFMDAFHAWCKPSVPLLWIARGLEVYTHDAKLLDPLKTEMERLQSIWPSDGARSVCDAVVSFWSQVNKDYVAATQTDVLLHKHAAQAQPQLVKLRKHMSNATSRLDVANLVLEANKDSLQKAAEEEDEFKRHGVWKKRMLSHVNRLLQKPTNQEMQQQTRTPSTEVLQRLEEAAMRKYVKNLENHREHLEEDLHSIAVRWESLEALMDAASSSLQSQVQDTHKQLATMLQQHVPDPAQTLPMEHMLNIQKELQPFLKRHEHVVDQMGRLGHIVPDPPDEWVQILHPGRLGQDRQFSGMCRVNMHGIIQVMKHIGTVEELTRFCSSK